MEKIYDPKNFRSSDPFNTKEYFQKYGQACPFIQTSSDDIKTKNKFVIIADMGVPEDEYDFDTLEESCSIDLLQLLDEPLNAIKEIPEPVTARTRLDVSYPMTEAAKSLNVVRCKEIVEKRTNMQMICNKRFLKPTVLSKTPDTTSLNDIIPGTNFVYSIYVYRPFSISYGQRNSGEKMRFAMEIEALGTNTLAEVVDTIECVSNMGLFKEVENTKIDSQKYNDAKKHYPSQTLFIDGVFYNDFRSSKAIDYSKVLIEWAKNNNIGKFTTAEMDKVVLESLTPRFGYPYVFIHHGNCEHIITFADARLIQPGDSLVSKKFPRIYSITRLMKPLCFLCSTAHSKWVVKDCVRFPQDKVFLCTDCCNSYLYIDGKKVGDFKLYPYYDIGMGQS